MKVSAVLSTAPTRDLAKLAARLESANCDGLYLADLTHDALLGAAVAATAANRMTIGTSIALAFTRSPTSLAYAAHDLNVATAGKFVLGLGPQVRQHIERRFGLPWSEPVKRMRETVLAIRAVWDSWVSGEPLSFDGDIFKLSLMPPAFRPEASLYARPPIFLAAVGPKMAELAGEVADGLFVHAFSTPAYVRSVIMPAVERGLARSGRSRSDFEISYSAFYADTSGASDIDEAREGARRSVAFYASTPDYIKVLEQHGLGQLQPELRELTRTGQWADMPALIDDRTLDLFCVTGAPASILLELSNRWADLVDQISLGADIWDRNVADEAWRNAVKVVRSTPSERSP